MRAGESTREPSLAQIVLQWGRIGCVGFGGPPAHVALSRALCVTRRRWLSDAQFERALAAVNLLTGPASTQLVGASDLAERSRLVAARMIFTIASHDMYCHSSASQESRLGVQRAAR